VGYYTPRDEGPPVLRILGAVIGIVLMFSSLGTIDLDTGDITVTTLPTRLYGMDFKGLNWQIAEYSWERDSTYSIMRDYGVNLIRRHFAGGPVVTGNTSYRARMDRCARLAAERGMWVIFDLFSYNVGYAPATRAEQNHNWDPNDPAGQWGDANWNAIWTNMGTWFKDHGNVMLELGNEPDDYDNTGWTSAMYERQRARYASTIAILRGLGFDNPIVIPGTGFGTTLSNWPSRAASLNDTNIIFDIHRYWWHQLRTSDPSATSVTDVRNAFNARGCDDLLNAGYRVLVGEFGVHGKENNQDSRDRTWFQSMLVVQRDDGYDSCYQSFQPGTDFPFRYFYEGWGTTYGGIPDTLQYYTGEEPGDGTLTVTAVYANNNIPIAADVTVTQNTAYITSGTTPVTFTLDASYYDLSVTHTDTYGNTTTLTRTTRVYADAATAENFTFPTPVEPTPEDAYTVQLLSSIGGSTVPGAGSYVLLITQLFTATAYAAADYVFTRWLRDDAEVSTDRTYSFSGTKDVTYVLQPVYTSTPGQPEEIVDWRRPNPYVPDPGDPNIDPVSGPRIPASLPAPALPLDDGALFTRTMQQLMRSHPPEFSQAIHQLRDGPPPHLAQLFHILSSPPIVTPPPTVEDLYLFDPTLFDPIIFSEIEDA
jgi:hypothetical protein